MEERIAVVVSGKDDGTADKTFKKIGASAEGAEHKVADATDGMAKSTTDAAAKVVDAEVAIKSAQVAQQKAALQLAVAQERLAKVTASSSSSDTAKQRAALAVASAELRQARATQQLAQATSSGTEKTEESHKSLLKLALASSAVAGAAAGASAKITEAVGAAAKATIHAGTDALLQSGTIRSQLQAQLGTTAADAARYGKLAGTLYAQNYGGSVDDVVDAIAKVKQAQAQLRVASDADLQDIAGKVLNVSSTFGVDLESVIGDTGKLLSNGLAPNADAALDVLVRGLQNGDNSAGDLIDTFEEYPPQFAKLGLSGTQALGLLNEGLKAGARNTDIVADALKEFSIRAVDGSALTAQGFASLGLSAQTMAERIGRGGKTATDALDLTLDRIRAIPDPVKRSQVAVALFGTQAEDLGAALFALDPSKAVASLGQVAGAADQLGAALGDNPRAKIDTFMRSLQNDAVNAAGAAVGAFQELPGPVQKVSALLIGVSGAAAVTATAVGTVGPKLKAARAELETYGRVGQFASSAVGSFGRVLGVGIPLLGIAAAAVSVFAKKKADEKRAVDDATQALLADNLALGENVRSSIVSRLEQDGLLKSAQTLGINLGTLTDAVYGHADAQQKVSAVLGGVTTSLEENKRATHQVSQADAERGKALHNLRDNLPGLIKDEGDAATAATRQRDATQQVTEATQSQAAVFGTTTGVIVTATKAVDEAGRSTKSFTGTARDATGQLTQYATAADLLKAKLDALNGVNTDVIESNIAYRNTLAALTASVKDNGKTLGEHTQKGRDNETALIAAAKAAAALSEAVANKSGYEAGRAQLVASRAELIKFAAHLGLSKTQVDALLNSILKLPPVKQTKVDAPGATSAAAKMNAVTRAANGIPGRATTRVAATGLDAVLNKFRNLEATIERVNGRAVSVRVGTGPLAVEHRSKGGEVTGGTPGQDSVLSLLMPGEYVETVAERRANRLRLAGRGPASATAFAGVTANLTVNIAKVVGDPAAVRREVGAAFDEFARKLTVGAAA